MDYAVITVSNADVGSCRSHGSGFFGPEPFYEQAAEYVASDPFWEEVTSVKGGCWNVTRGREVGIGTVKCCLPWRQSIPCTGVDSHIGKMVLVVVLSDE